MSYVVRINEFEGPLDLLLHLIQKEEMDIYDIPIARITQQYLEEIERMERLDLHPAGEYLVMAATLMRIKARMLLPVRRPGEEEDEDPRQELVQRLLEYKKFKEAAKKLREHEDERSKHFTRPLDESLLDEVRQLGAEETFEVSLSQVIKALQTVLARIETVTSHDIDLEPVSMEEKKAAVAQRLDREGRVSFQELFAKDRTRIEVIVTFMALLELVKGGSARVHQADNFSEIWIFAHDGEGVVAEEEKP